MARTDLAEPWLDPLQIAVDPSNGSTWHDVVVRAAAVTGAARFTLVRSFTASDDLDVARLVPEGLTVTADSVCDGGQQLFLTGIDAVATVRVAGPQIDVYAAASTAGTRDALDAFYGELFPPSRIEPELVKIHFVYADSGLRRMSRWVHARSWPDVRCYYPASAAASLDRLVGTDSDPSGRIVLLHGPPGTGKTTGLLTLAREWQSWCNLVFVLDPEELFSGPPGYVLEVAVAADTDRWQMLVVEDAAGLLRPSRGESMHPGLARLLNLSDGALGQGMRLLVCVTTNEPLSRVHPALRRPGRCLADIHIGELSPHEANALLCPALHTREPITLAELLERRGELSRLGDKDETVSVGAYL